MAAGKFTVLNVALAKMTDGTIRVGVDGLKLALCEAAEALSETWTGTSGDGLYSDLGAEVTGPGYTAGGVDLDVSVSQNTGVLSVSADPSVWTGVTITAKFGVVYKATGDLDVLGFFDLETSDPAGRVVTASDLTISWPNDLLTLTRT